MASKKTIVAGTVIGALTLGLGSAIALSRHKQQPIKETVQVTVNGTTFPLSIPDNSKVTYVVSGPPGHSVEIFYSSTDEYSSSAFTKPSLNGTLDSQGKFTTYDTLTNGENQAFTFYVGVLDKNTDTIGNFVEVTIEKAESECPCGQILVDGTCQSQIPAEIAMPISATHPLRYNVGTEITGVFQCGNWACALAPYDTQSCPTTPPSPNTCTTDTIDYFISGKVVDSAGNPICGVPVNIDSVRTKLPDITWSVSEILGSFNGSIQPSVYFLSFENIGGLQTPVPTSTGTTSATGEFTVWVQYKINLTKTPNCTLPALSGSTTGEGTITIGIDISNTDLYALTEVTIPYTICAYIG